MTGSSRITQALLAAFAALCLCIFCPACSDGASPADAGDGFAPDSDPPDGAGAGDDGADDTGDQGDEDDVRPPGTLSAWRSFGPPGGDRFLLRVDPHDPSRVVVVGHGGVHRSTSRGDTWEAVHTQQMQGSLFALAFDPATRNRLAVGSNRSGVFVSDDAGDTWSPRSSGLPAITAGAYYHEIQSLAFTGDGRLWASVRGATTVTEVVFVSEDQGRTWTPSPGVPKGEVTQLFVSGDRLYAVSSEHGPYRRAGGAWESMAGDLADGALAGTYLAVDASDPDRAFLGTSRDGLYRTTDGGIHWSRLDLPEDLSPGDPAPLVYYVVIDPVTPDIVWAGLYNAEAATESPLFVPDDDQVSQCGAGSCAGRYVTLDGGDSWMHLVVSTHSGFRLTLDPSETVTDTFGTRSKYFYLTAGGMSCVTRSDDGGVTHCRRIQGIHGVYINALHENGGRLFTAGEQGITFTDDRGTSWTYRRPADTIVYTWDMTPAPDDPDHLLWATGEPAWGFPGNKGVWRSDIVSCTEVVPVCTGDPPFVPCPKQNLLEDIGVWRLVVEPSGQRRVYALTQEAGIRVGNGVDTSWTDLSQGLQESSVTALLLDDTGSPWLSSTRTCRGDYTPTCSWVPQPAETGGVYYHQDGVWHRAPGVEAAVLDLAHDRHAGGVYAATTQGVYRSLDAGRTWEPASTGLPDPALLRVARSVVADPRSPGVVYAGCLDGVFRTVDGGEQWTSLDDGLLNRVTDRMIFVPGDPDRIFVATLGGSVFVADIIR